MTSRRPIGAVALLVGAISCAGESSTEHPERALRAAYVAARQAEGADDPRYHIDKMVAAAPGGLVGRFDAMGVALTAQGLAGRLELAAISCGGRGFDVLAEGPAEVRSNRLVQRRGAGIEEWWINGPLGLEQGFDLDVPDCLGEVEIDVAASGFTATATAGAVRLRGAAGSLFYGELYAVDATGAKLPARLGASGSTVHIRVDAARAVWPISIDPLIYTTEQKVQLATDGDAMTSDNLGSSVALSADTAIIGAPNDQIVSAAAQGSVYVFVRSGGLWTKQAKLTAADGAPNDRFGSSVALEGDTAVVGSPNASVGATLDAGAAYVFVRSGTTWTQQAKLVAAAAMTREQLGTSVALEGDTAIVGAIMDPSNAAGAAYVFTRSGTAWTERARLAQSAGAAGDAFGCSVALSGDTVLVGASGVDSGGGGGQGRAYVFRGAGASWSEEAQLNASDVVALDGFASQVALSADTALVGSPLADIGASSDRGAAYVFVRSGTTWGQQQKLLASNGDATDRFGSSVALLGDTALVGSPNADNPTSGQGMAYVYTRSGTTWTEQAGLTAPAGDIQTAADYGRAVALATDVALIGSPQLDLPGFGFNQGAAFVLTRSGSTWSNEAKLTAGRSAATAYFGSDVSLSPATSR